MKDYKEAIESIMKDTTSKVIEHAINAHRQGYENGQKEKLATALIYDREVAEKKAYEQGLNDVWEVIKKITEDEEKGGYSIDMLNKLFGNAVVYDIVHNYTPQEAIAKIKEHEDKQKDKVKETDLERKPPKADCDKCAQKGFCGHPEPIKEVVRENGCYGFIPY